MARIRSIKPEFWKSEAIACHDFFTRLVFIGLWTYVDDNGVGVDNHRLITAELFPLEEDFAQTSRDLRDSLARLADAGRIRRYTVDGKAYLAIVNWSEHQRVDRPNKPRYPQPDDPRATENPPPTSPNANPDTAPRDTLDEPSRDCRDTPAPGAGEQGNRGTGDNPSALASLDAAEPDIIDAEIVDHPAALVAVPDPPDAPEPENAGHITKQWIDHCTANHVKLTKNHIKRYGAGIKTALTQGFPPPLIKRALADMLADRVASRPALLDTYLVRTQQGPELPPRRMTRGEAAAARHAPTGSDIGALIHDALTRPAS